MKVFQPVMWVYLTDGYTVRWRRGDDVAYVFADRQAGIAMLCCVTTTRGLAA